jgi:hypothetical protein
MKKQFERNHAGILVFLTIALLGLLFMLPPISQDKHYHHFSDDITFFGIPNFMNVASNIPFILIGIIGLRKIMKIDRPDFPKTAMIFFFIGVLLTGFGSAYYHWQPDNHSLFWDRLPMTITFMSLFSAVISLHMEEWSGKMLLFPLLIIGIGSVLYWYFTELKAQGDLRPYVFVQFYPMIIIPLIMFLYPVKGAAVKILLPMIGFYAVAKYFEYGDESLYSLGHLMSGHTLKHLFAALATVAMLNTEKIYQSNFKEEEPSSH